MTAPLLRTSERKDWRRCPHNGGRNCPPCQRERKLMSRYGITVAQWEALLAAQNGRCAICPIKLGQSAHVDHDHDTGRVRGLLCRNCNMNLGWYEQNQEEICDYLAATAPNI